jgi:hypothetical protein
MDANRRGGAVLAAPPRLTLVHNIKLTETRRYYALSVGASGRGAVGLVRNGPQWPSLKAERWTPVREVHRLICRGLRTLGMHKMVLIYVTHRT